MVRTTEDSLRWVADGNELLDAALVDLTDASLRAPSQLPGWSRGHVVAHVNANADALLNLVHWAATGEPTPMYASPDARTRDIEQGSTLTRRELAAWFARSRAEFDRATGRLDDDQWSREVVTAQGRAVPAGEIPWLRAREVLVHAVDLTAGRPDAVGFADLPADFLAALVCDVVARRGLTELPEGPLAEVAAWLAGRPYSLVDAPVLGAWL